MTPEYSDIHYHHKRPRCQGGTDEYKNLVIVHEDICRLIHATNSKIISQYISEYKETIDLHKLNELRALVDNAEIIFG